MQVTIQPGRVSGIIQANASKSAMQRACAAALLSPVTTIIHNPGISNDDKAALEIIQKLGAVVEHLQDGTTKVVGTGGFIIPPLGVDGAINCGESGLSIRMFTPIASLSNREITITGEGSLINRPMDFFDEVMPMVGVKIKSHNGKLPILVKGPLQPADITIDGSLSSQFLTGLLMAYGAAPQPPERGKASPNPITNDSFGPTSEGEALMPALNGGGAIITVINLKSKPYIDLTLEIMKAFGLNVPENRNYEQFVFSNRNTDYHQALLANHHYTIEGDWSGAAFLLVAGAVTGTVTVNGIFNTSRQADKKIVDAILDAGAEVKVTATTVTVHNNELRAFVFDATDCPDLFPPLVALAANCSGVTRIHGLKRLKHKESDRGITLQEEFSKLGIRIDLNDDIMLVYGMPHIKILNQTLNSHHDHRIAMAAVVAALNADFEIKIRHAEAIDKSYPDFYRHMQQLGVQIEISQ